MPFSPSAGAGEAAKASGAAATQSAAASGSGRPTAKLPMAISPVSALAPVATPR